MCGDAELLKKDCYLNKKNTNFKISISIPGIRGYICGVIVFFFIFTLCPISISASKSKSPKKKPGKSAAVSHSPVKSGKTSDKKKRKEEESGTPVKKEAQPLKKNAEGDKKDQSALYSYEKPEVEEESYAWLIFKTILVLGMLVGGFYYFFRFVTKKAGIQVLGKDVINVLSLVPVGQNKFMQVVEIAGRMLVIGVTDNNISLITEIDDKEEIDRIRLLSSKSTPPKTGGFQEYISKQVERVLGREKGEDVQSTPGAVEREEDTMDFLRRQRKRLRDLNGVENEK